MSEYKIVATDLDGTLLNNNSRISAGNLSAIKALLSSGVHFVPASGRSFSEMPQEIRNNPDIRYIIHSNGAVVYDRKTGKRILRCISKELAGKVLDILNSYSTHLSFRYNGKCYVDARFQKNEDYEYFNVGDCHKRVVTEYAVFTEDFEKFSYSVDYVEVFSVFFSSDTEKDDCKKKLMSIGELFISETWDHNLEITAAEISKGKALRSLVDMLGLDCSQTIAVGDGDNDSTLLEAAGLGLAVSNAVNSLKSSADEIICSNEEDAIDYILNHYIRK